MPKFKQWLKNLGQDKTERAQECIKRLTDQGTELCEKLNGAKVLNNDKLQIGIPNFDGRGFNEFCIEELANKGVVACNALKSLHTSSAINVVKLTPHISKFVIPVMTHGAKAENENCFYVIDGIHQNEHIQIDLSSIYGLRLRDISTDTTHEGGIITKVVNLWSDFSLVCIENFNYELDHTNFILADAAPIHYDL